MDIRSFNFIFGTIYLKNIIRMMMIILHYSNITIKYIFEIFPQYYSAMWMTYSICVCSN